MTRVACAQLDVAFNDPGANADRAVQTMRECRAQGAGLVVFPECFLTGYCVSSLDEARSIALLVNPGAPLESPVISLLSRECRELGVHAVVGFAHDSGTRLLNSAALLTPEGRVEIYSKTHMPCLGLDKFVETGDDLPVFDTSLGKIGVLVCFDLRVPEAARVLTLKGAEIIVLPTNWPEGAYAAPEFMASCRAAENRVFLATCDRVGTENGFTFIGQSGIYGVGGRALAKAGSDEEVIFADVDLEQARTKRNVIDPGRFETEMIASRRPELYGHLTRSL